MVKFVYKLSHQAVFCFHQTDKLAVHPSNTGRQAASKKASSALRIYRFFTMKLFSLFSNLTVQITFSVVMLASSGYIYLFGESGYYTIQELKKDIYHVQAITEELLRENEELNEKYIALAENARKNGTPELSSASAQEAIILKFDDYKKNPDETRETEKPVYVTGNQREEIRTLYAFFSFVFTVVIAFFSRKIPHWINQRRNAVSDGAAG
jgi:hypothetical protein